MSLIYIGQQITIYGGLFLVVAGVIGNGINTLVFSTVRKYRTTPCTFYFLVASIFNIAFLTVNLISRIVGAGFGIDLTQTSSAWCKIRQFCLMTLSLIALSCSCLATIDQYFATSQSAYRRGFSNIKSAHRIVFIVIIFWCLHGIPMFFFYDASPIVKSCVNINSIYAIYVSIYLLGLLCIVPVFTMVLFGYLTYRNIQLTRALAEQHADRQITRMILIQVVFVVICLVPYGINFAYVLITSSIVKDRNRLINENFATAILIMISYIYFAGICYLFLLSSSRYRRETKSRILFCFKMNQVTPTIQASAGTRTVDRRTRS